MMLKHTRDFTRFARHLWVFTTYAGEVLVVLNLLIFCGGVAIWMVEDIALEPAIYFAFITGLTVGYGDIAPETTLGHVISVLIAFVGTVFVGLIVAVAARALSETVKERHAAEAEETR
jgi:hypothetical protein